jgi:hypothetical protein
MSFGERARLDLDLFANTAAHAARLAERARAYSRHCAVMRLQASQRGGAGRGPAHPIVSTEDHSRLIATLREEEGRMLEEASQLENALRAQRPAAAWMADAPDSSAPSGSPRPPPRTAAGDTQQEPVAAEEERLARLIARCHLDIQQLMSDGASGDSAGSSSGAAQAGRDEAAEALLVSRVTKVVETTSTQLAHTLADVNFQVRVTSSLVRKHLICSLPSRF